MLAVDVDLAIELRELSLGRAKELMHTETDRWSWRIELISLFCQGGRAQAGDYEGGDRISQSHLELFFASAASVFKSGVRESGNRPNKFPSAKAAL